MVWPTLLFHLRAHGYSVKTITAFKCIQDALRLRSCVNIVWEHAAKSFLLDNGSSICVEQAVQQKSRPINERREKCESFYPDIYNSGYPADWLVLRV